MTSVTPLLGPTPGPILGVGAVPIPVSRFVAFITWTLAVFCLMVVAITHVALILVLCLYIEGSFYFYN